MTLQRGNPLAAGSSLGAVGGPRGVGAGALRVIVEFITQYDPAAARKLEADITKLQAADKRGLGTIQNYNQHLRAQHGLITRIENLRTKVTRQQLLDIRKNQALLDQGQTSQAIAAKKRLEDIAKATGLRKTDMTFLGRSVALEEGAKKRIATLTSRIHQAEQRVTASKKQQSVLSAQLLRIDQLRANLAPKLAALGIGVVGGFIGLAIFGTLFGVLGDAVDKLKERIEDIVDPAHKARESIEDLAKAIEQVASEKNISRIEAAKELLHSLGLVADERTAEILEEAAALKFVTDLENQRAQVVDIVANSQLLKEELVNKVYQRMRIELDQLIKKYEAAGVSRQALSAIRPELFPTQEKLYADALDEVNRMLRQQIIDAANAAEAVRQQANAAAFAAIVNERLAGALQAASAAQIAPLQTRLSGLEATPSARTLQLEASIEKLQGGGGGGTSREAANIAEERALVLLRQRLRLLGTAIDIERYEGKFRLEAINAKIEALRREGDQQERVNKLLDLQYRMTLTIRRQQGESIADFLERRAQEQRALLAEQDELQREAQISELERQRDIVQDQIALQELAERRRQALASGGTSARLKLLQKELDASRKADQKRYESQKAAIQKQIDELERLTRLAQELLDERTIAETRAGIASVKTLRQLAELSGRIAGYTQVRGIIKAWQAAGLISAQDAASILANIDKLLNFYENKFASFARRGVTPISGPAVPLQHGGVIPLTNAMQRPFGANIRTGESGTELGVVLSNRVTQALKDYRGITFGNIQIYGVDNKMRDPYWVRRTVREAVEEVIR